MRLADFVLEVGTVLRARCNAAGLASPLPRFRPVLGDAREVSMMRVVTSYPGVTLEGMVTSGKVVLNFHQGQR